MVDKQVAAVLMKHQVVPHYLAAREHCRCGWISAELPYRDQSHCDHVAAKLKSIIRERQREAWDECDVAWGSAHAMSNYEPQEHVMPNPYGQNPC